MPPMVRLTALGIRQVGESTKEAALAFGANPRQLLTKVELPLALPSIMTGINQVVMMSLSMVVVAALIGAGGMGFVVTEALENTETGRGIAGRYRNCTPRDDDRPRGAEGEYNSPIARPRKGAAGPTERDRNEVDENTADSDGGWCRVDGVGTGDGQDR